MVFQWIDGANNGITKKANKGTTNERKRIVRGGLFDCRENFSQSLNFCRSALVSLGFVGFCSVEFDVQWTFSTPGV